MTEQQVEDDHTDFVAVTSHRSRNIANNNQYARRNNKKGKGRYIPPIEKPLSELLEQKIDQLTGSTFLKACIDVLRDNSRTFSRRKYTKCLCFGLGSFRHSPKSLLQLALLQLLLQSDIFEIDAKPISMDPEFIAEDTELLTGLGHQVVEYQEDILELTEDTFLYMPHCPRWLYELLLETNKEKLDKAFLLSNDLSLYAEREIRIEELKKIPRLRQLGDALHTFALPEYEERPDAFNDMAWQWTRSSVKGGYQDTERDSPAMSDLTASIADLSVKAGGKGQSDI